MTWQEKAIVLLEQSLYPIPQELNGIDWKSGLSENTDRLAQHICAFSNLSGGGVLAFGIDNSGEFLELSQENIEKISSRLDNIAQNRMVTPIQLEHAVLDFNGHPVLMVHIPEYREKPMYLRGADVYNTFIRSTGHTVRMSRQQVRSLIAESENVSFEEKIIGHGYSYADVLSLLDFKKFFELLKRQIPSSQYSVLSTLEEFGLCVKENVGYGITNLGAILFANDISKFASIRDRSVIVRHYKGNNNRNILFEQTGQKGYAVGFEGLVNYITKQTSTEKIEGPVRDFIPTYPKVAIREFVANALVHQDFSVTGMPLTIEIFDNRMVITNPGYSLNDVNRLIDLPPHSRNERMAQTMLQLGLCERRGSGIDRAVDAIEKMLLPAYKAENGADFTRVTLFPKKTLGEMTKEERIVACYQHCCLLYADGTQMNNQSVRERFGLNKNQTAIASHIISDTIAQGLIKSSNPDSESKKFVSYIPFYG